MSDIAGPNKANTETDAIETIVRSPAFIMDSKYQVVEVSGDQLAELCTSVFQDRSPSDPPRVTFVEPTYGAGDNPPLYDSDKDIIQLSIPPLGEVASYRPPFLYEELYKQLMNGLLQAARSDIYTRSNSEVQSLKDAPLKNFGKFLVRRSVQSERIAEVRLAAIHRLAELQKLDPKDLLSADAATQGEPYFRIVLRDKE